MQNDQDVRLGNAAMQQETGFGSDTPMLTWTAKQSDSANTTPREASQRPQTNGTPSIDDGSVSAPNARQEAAQEAQRARGSLMARGLSTTPSRAITETDVAALFTILDADYGPRWSNRFQSVEAVRIGIQRWAQELRNRGIDYAALCEATRRLSTGFLKDPPTLSEMVKYAEPWAMERTNLPQLNYDPDFSNPGYQEFLRLKEGWSRNDD